MGFTTMSEGEDFEVNNHAVFLASSRVISLADVRGVIRAACSEHGSSRAKLETSMVGQFLNSTLLVLSSLLMLVPLYLQTSIQQPYRGFYAASPEAIPSTSLSPVPFMSCLDSPQPLPSRSPLSPAAAATRICIFKHTKGCIVTANRQ